MVRFAFTMLLLFTNLIVLSQAQRPILHPTRQDVSDLEITGMVNGLKPGATAFIRRADLLALPQTRAVITDDLNLHGTLHVSGLSFETIRKAIGALPTSDLVDIRCVDRYRSHYPAEYVRQHHPILVLTIDGKTLGDWGRASHQYDTGPFVVMYLHFVPAFKVLAHADEPQIPDNIVRMNFTTEAATFDQIVPRGTIPTPDQNVPRGTISPTSPNVPRGTIASSAGQIVPRGTISIPSGENVPRGTIAPVQQIVPRGTISDNSPEQMGFTIAKQNCLRCHFYGSSGGTKSGRTWQSLGVWAREQPDFFQGYIQHPERFEAHTHMAGSPQYDKATLAALTAYFRTFAGENR